MLHAMKRISHALDIQFRFFLYSFLKLIVLYRDCIPGEAGCKHMGPKLRDIGFPGIIILLSSGS
jgi:hypothetical protein